MRHVLLVLAALLAALPSSASSLRPAWTQDGAGPPAGAPAETRETVVAIEVQGLAAHDPVRIAQRLGIVVGQPIPLDTRAAQTQLHDDFRILVDTGGYSFEEVEGGVIVHLRFVESPVDLDPQFVGNVHFDVEQLREWALLNDRVPVYVSEADRIKDRIRRAYQRQGYHFVEVQHLVGGEGIRRQEIIFEIFEGPKVYIKRVRIEGNDSMPDEGILLWRQSVRKRSRIQAKGRGLFAWKGHRLDMEVVDADMIAIAELYRNQGFMDVVVDSRVEFSENRSAVELTYTIDEGPLYTVSSVDIQGVEIETVEGGEGFQPEVVERPADLSIPIDELRDLLALKKGEPYEAVRVQIDRQRLQDRYGEEGHIDARRFVGGRNADRGRGWRFLDPAVVYDYENKTVAVIYQLQQGRPFFMRTLEIEGNADTKDEVIRRRFAQLPGAKVDAKKMRDGLARVRRTGFFDDDLARGTHPPPTLSYRVVEDQPDLVDAIVGVTEGRTIQANLSGGVASDQGLVGIASVQINNFDAQRLPRSWLGVFGEIYRKEAFTGDGETFGVDLSPGSEVSYWRLFYSHPDILGRHFDPIGTLVEVQSRDRIFRSHDEGRTYARAAITRAFGQGDVQMSAGVRWQNLETSDLDDELPLPRTLTRTAPEETYVGLTGSISANKLDNRRLPRTGWTARWSNTVYSESIGSDANLWKSELSYDRYFHLSTDTESAAPGIYLGLGAGLAVPMDRSKGSVNYGERFFFGGARFGRGFRFRGIGPYEGDFPLGGETYARTTLEYRFPLYTQSVPGTSRRREVFRGSFFMDAGVLGPEAYELDLADTRISYGFALGLIDPFPITFSFGWPLQSEDEDERQVFAFSLSLR